MHTLMVGFSPPYVALAMSQIPLLGHGELAKVYGHGPAALAIGKAGKPALDVMRAVMGSPDWAHFGVREDALRKAGIPEKNIATVMKLANAGVFTSYTQSMTGLHEGASPMMTKIKNAANLMGVSAEQYPRLIIALAAANLHDGNPAKAKMERDDYIKNVVEGSQYKWGAGETSRVLGRLGPLGAFTKISLGFMNFQTQMVQKLYSEMHEVLTNQMGNRKQAGTFLASHLVGVIALAGTLGLPGAQIFSGAFDKVYQALTGRDDMDVQGLYRTWMTNTFGADIADVIAKGLPRGAGVDLSKVGDQNLIPGTGFMTDKRKWEDASKDWFKSMAGAGGNEIGNLVLAARDMMNGDYLRGAMKALPEGFKGLSEGYYYSKNGYVDKDGTPLPIASPKALDIILLTLGYDPANLARYQEDKRVSTGLEAQREFRSQNISQHVTRAIQTGDQASLKSWINAAVDFQVHNPGMSGPLEDIESSLSTHVKQGVMARATGAPLGMGVLDPNRASTGFLGTP
jgi:hypothetical protein